MKTNMPCDAYAKRTGFVFVANDRKIIFQCTRCANILFTAYEAFAKHILSHYTAGETDTNVLPNKEELFNHEASLDINAEDEQQLNVNKIASTSNIYSELKVYDKNCDEYTDNERLEETDVERLNLPPNFAEEEYLLPDFNYESEQLQNVLNAEENATGNAHLQSNMSDDESIEFNQELQNALEEEEISQVNKHKYIVMEPESTDMNILSSSPKRKCKKLNTSTETTLNNLTKSTAPLYSCKECNKLFHSESELQKHIKLWHNIDYIFKCKECNLAFKEKYNLRKHLQRHTGQKEHSCQQCSQKFYTRTELQAHERIHTVKFPFICDECGKCWSTSGALHEHRKRHTNSRQNHKCEICNKCFFDFVSFTQRNPKYLCGICHMSFAYRQTLNNHLKVTHRVTFEI